MAWWKNRARGLRGLEKTESDGDGLSNTQGGRTAEIAGLRLSPLAQLLLNSPCLVKQDDRGEGEEEGPRWGKQEAATSSSEGRRHFEGLHLEVWESFGLILIASPSLD